MRQSNLPSYKILDSPAVNLFPVVPVGHIEWKQPHMDARPLLARIARMLEEQRLEAVLIGNAAAALQGAPVTTVDFDFMFRKTPANLRKLKALARALDAVILRPYYLASDLFRIVRDDDGLQLDFMMTVRAP